MRRVFDRLAPLLAIVGLLGWGSPADASTECGGSSAGGLPTLLGGVAVAGAGTPAYIAEESRLTLGGGPSTFGAVRSDGEDPVAFAVDGTVQGYWKQFGYRADFFSTERGTECDHSFFTNISAAFSYIALQSDASELRVSVGAGGTLGLGAALDFGVAGRVGIAGDFGLEGRVRYLPHIRESERGSTHFARSRLRFEWRVARGFQPFAGVAGVFVPSGAEQFGDGVSPDSMYLTGLIGFESNWSR